MGQKLTSDDMAIVLTFMLFHVNFVKCLVKFDVLGERDFSLVEPKFGKIINKMLT